MLSVESSSQAGSREKPRSMARSIASSIVSSASTATMSGRGSITSRTTVSPNSKIEWMSRRSSRSMTSSSAATSAIVRISSSVTNGPSFRPLPGSTTLAMPMSSREKPAQRREVGEEPQHRRDRERGAFGVLDRVRLRRDLADHEEQDDLQHDADDDAERARAALEQHTEQRGRRELRHEHEEQHDVERPLRVLEHVARDWPARLPPSSCERDRADAAHPGERRLRGREPDRDHEQHDDDDEDRPVGTAHRCSAPRTRRCSSAPAR